LGYESWGGAQNLNDGLANLISSYFINFREIIVESNSSESFLLFFLFLFNYISFIKKYFTFLTASSNLSHYLYKAEAMLIFKAFLALFNSSALTGVVKSFNVLIVSFNTF
jgi:hypothetical protein